MGLRIFATVWELLWYNCFQFVGCLLNSSIVELTATSSKRTYATGHASQACSQSPVPAACHCWQCLCRRHSYSQRQVWFSLLWKWLLLFPGSCCAQCFVSTLQVSLACLKFDFKHDCVPPTILLGFLLCFCMWGIFFGGIWHSPVHGCSATSCDFGVLAGEHECMSFYCTILDCHWSACIFSN